MTICTLLSFSTQFSYGYFSFLVLAVQFLDLHSFALFRFVWEYFAVCFVSQNHFHVKQNQTRGQMQIWSKTSLFAAFFDADILWKQQKHFPCQLIAAYKWRQRFLSACVSVWMEPQKIWKVWARMISQVLPRCFFWRIMVNKSNHQVSQYQQVNQY